MYMCTCLRAAEGVCIMEASTFIQEAAVLVGSQLQVTLAHAQQVIVEGVVVVNLEPQDVALLGLEVGELLLPPGVDGVMADGCHTQTGRATVHLDVAVCDSKEVGGKIGGAQVEHAEVGLSHTQAAQDQQEDKAGGHGDAMDGEQQVYIEAYILKCSMFHVRSNIKA